MREQLNIIKNALPKRSTMPVLANILLKGGVLTASDLELTMSVAVDSNIECLLPPKTVEVVNAIEGDVKMELHGQQLHISSERGQFKLATDAGIDDYPAIDHVQDLHPLPLEFINALQSVVFACSIEQSRPAFMGVLTEVIDNELTLTASDTYRLARAKMKLNHPDCRVLIPNRILKEIVRMKPAKLEIGIAESAVTFVADGVLMTSRLLGEKYPDVSSVIPTAPKTTITLDYEELAESVKRVGLLADGKNKAVGLTVADSTLTVSVKGQEGDGEEILPIECDGENVELFVNSTYFAEGLKGSGVIQFHGVGGPIILVRQDYIYLVLPIKKV